MNDRGDTLGSGEIESMSLLLDHAENGDVMTNYSALQLEPQILRANRRRNVHALERE